MKKYIITTIWLLSSLLYAGCSDWLDVSPQSESPKDKLFETQNGFRSALTGAYIRLKGGSLYGGALMWGDIEYMACNWYNPTTSNTTLNELLNCNYNNAGVVSKMDAIYENLYKVIADVNSILEEIDNRKSVFSDGNYEMIKGEALNLRAFCHFDILRLFGPMPANVGDSELFPYVTTVTEDIHPSLTYQDYTKNILKDLDEAQELLKGVDPILTYSIADLSDLDSGDFTTDDNYIGYRNLRMNYYATLAIKARVYLWMAGQDPTQKANAARYAQMVIDAKDNTGTPTFRLGIESDRVAGDYTFSSEHIMALSVYDLAATADNLFGEQGQFVRYDFSIQDGFYYLNNLFPVSERVSDVRWNSMWSYRTTSGQTNYVMYKKFVQNAEISKRILQVPLLRLSEMYLILTECAETKENAEIPYKFYCDKKGIPFIGFSDANWEGDRRNKLIREYVREFYAEGQSFFTYKRFNVTSLPAGWAYPSFSGTLAKYVVPKPLREIEYNNK
ncbi:RagB/SusD family nutrient uptake outer membrane protein [uncultured Bacteroides sp.]|uniref:RagB/SusD family nutrient uptake outer membrane protein n=1 Tax=uncultured Bacteroides sp. TaxID=162156 RepID=UPI002AA6A2A0|nr:RagB/SusD family nutrient uptake outer membrane protein [uncultured Bacteroides sp.]